MAGPTSAERVDRDPLFDISEDSGGAGVAAACEPPHARLPAVSGPLAAQSVGVHTGV